MPFIPLPFVVTIVLALLMLRLFRSENGQAPDRIFLVLIGACAVQSALIGLRWGYGVEQLRNLLPLTASIIPALTLASFGSIASAASLRKQAAFCLLSISAIAIELLLWRGAIDVTLILIYLGYALALFRLARAGTDGLTMARFGEARSAHAALLVAALALLASALVDISIIVDLDWWVSRNHAAFIGLANLSSLLVLGLAANVASQARAIEDEISEAHTDDRRMNEAETPAILKRIEELVKGQKLYRDPELGLNRLSRRAGITARRISNAVNRIHGKTVSQYVNQFRIEEAKRLLQTTSDPVTKIMFEAGFQTKSNFNHEFRKLTGMSPKDWRNRMK